MVFLQVSGVKQLHPVHGVAYLVLGGGVGLNPWPRSRSGLCVWWGCC